MTTHVVKQNYAMLPKGITFNPCFMMLRPRTALRRVFKVNSIITTDCSVLTPVLHNFLLQSYRRFWTELIQIWDYQHSSEHLGTNNTTGILHCFRRCVMGALFTCKLSSFSSTISCGTFLFFCTQSSLLAWCEQKGNKIRYVHGYVQPFQTCSKKERNFTFLSSIVTSFLLCLSAWKQ